MYKYTKIETPYKRDMDGSKDLMEGVFRDEAVEYLKDCQWVGTEKVDGCLAANTKLCTTDGDFVTIKDIVEKRMPVELWGMRDGNIVKTKVLDWHKNGIGNEWIKINYVHRTPGTKGGGTYRTITCTPNHKFYVNGEYKRADALRVGDLLTVMGSTKELSYQQKSIITGLIIGDGGLVGRSVEFSHKEAHEEYVDWLIESLGEMGGNKSKPRISGYGTRIIPGRTVSHKAIEEFCQQFYDGGKKIIPKNVWLSPLTLAVLYMDDGSIQKNDNQIDRIVIALNDYDAESVQNFVDSLAEQHNIASSVVESKGYSIRLNWSDAEAFQMLVAPYICDCMQYKLSEKYRGFFNNVGCVQSESRINQVLQREILSIEKFEEPKFRYDLTTETHNYFANNVLVHNCNIGIYWDGHKVSFQGRTERAQIPAQLLDKLQEMFGGDTNEEIFEQMFGEREAVFYGEGYGPKIQKGGGLYRDDVSFIMFDIYLPASNLWLKREAIEEIAKAFNVEVVPIVFRGTLGEAVAYIKCKPLSHIAGKPLVMEGIVCKPNVELMTRMGERIIVKVKVKDFC